MHIKIIEKRIEELKFSLARDMEKLLTLEHMKYEYYERLMGTKERYECD